MMKTSKTKQILNIMKIICWVIFIGLCVQTGAIIISFIVSLFNNAEGGYSLYMKIYFTDLFRFSTWHYVMVVGFVIIIYGLKASMFYLAIKIFSKMSLVQPFNITISLLITKISYVALGIALVILATDVYVTVLIRKGVHFPNLGTILDGASGYLLLGGIIFAIAQVYALGIEIQAENDLTV